MLEPETETDDKPITKEDEEYLDRYLEHVKMAASHRGDVVLHEDFYILAIHEINTKNLDVPKYPNGVPSLKSVSDLAIQIRRTMETVNAIPV